MSVVKALLRQPIVQDVLSLGLAGWLRFVHASGRWRVVRPECLDRARAMAGGAVLRAFWHGPLPLIWAVPRGNLETGHVLISAHRDGRLIAKVMERMGASVVTGSSSRGGAQAYREMARLLRNGGTGVITPDGPRGPRMHAANGAVALARLAGVPLVPLAFSAKRVRFLKSWDRMQFVWPFGEGVYVFGEPFLVPKEADDLEPWRRKLEDSLNAVTREADLMMGLTPIEPARPGEAKR